MPPPCTPGSIAPVWCGACMVSRVCVFCCCSDHIISLAGYGEEMVDGVLEKYWVRSVACPGTRAILSAPSLIQLRARDHHVRSVATPGARTGVSWAGSKSAVATTTARSSQRAPGQYRSILGRRSGRASSRPSHAEPCNTLCVR